MLELEFLDPFTGRLGQTTANGYVARDSKVGHPRFTPSNQLFLRDLVSFLQDDDCLDFFFAELRWHTDDASFQHSLVSSDHGFHFKGGNIFSTAPDGLFFTVDKKEMTVLVHATEITSMNPAVAEQFQRSLGFVVITGGTDEHLVRACDEFAQTAWLALLVVIVNDPDIPASDGFATGPGPGFIIRTDQAAIAFGHAVNFENLGIEALLEGMPLVLRCRCADHQPDRVVGVIFTRILFKQDGYDSTYVIGLGAIPAAAIIPQAAG